MSDQTIQEAVAEIWDLFRETDKKFQETDKKFQETDRKLRQLEGAFGMQWGRMMEALVEPAALDLLRARGVKVSHTYSRVKVQQDGDNREFDVVLENGDEVVIVEVKSTLRVQDVVDFLDDLAHMLDFFPRYQDHRILGAVAGLEIAEEADRFAYKQGLFVLSISGEGVVNIRNDDKFQAKDFNPHL